MGKRANPAVVGAFVVGAVVLAVTAVVLFGSGRLFRTTYPYVIFFSGDVNGLKEGAPVKFKGVQVGSVTEILLNVGQMTLAEAASEGKKAEVRIPVIIELDEKTMREKGGTMAPTPDRLKGLIDLGLRAQLSMESFVTGLLYVKLDVFPGSPINLVNDPSVKYPEIPSLPTPLEEVQMEAAKFLAKLKDLNVEELVNSLASTAKGIDRLVNSPRLAETIETLPETQKKLGSALDEMTATLQSVKKVSGELGSQLSPLGQRLQAAAKEAEEALRNTNTTLQRASALLEPDSPTVYRLGKSLDDLSAAARAIRRFAEELERNPSVLVRGKATSEETK